MQVAVRRRVARFVSAGGAMVNGSRAVPLQGIGSRTGVRLFALIVMTLCFLVPTLIGLYFASQIVGNTSPLDTTVANVVDSRLPAGRVSITVRGTLQPGSLDVSGRRCQGCTIYLIVDPASPRKGILVRSKSQLGQVGSVVTVTGRLNELALQGDWLTWAAKEPGAPSVPSTQYLDTATDIWVWTIGMGVFGALFSIPTVITGLLTLAYLVGYLRARRGEYVGFVSGRASGSPVTDGILSAATPVTVTGLLWRFEPPVGLTRLRDVPATLSAGDGTLSQAGPGLGGGRYTVRVNGDQLALEIDADGILEAQTGWVYLVGPSRPAIRLRWNSPVTRRSHPIVLAFTSEVDRDAVFGPLATRRSASVPGAVLARR